MKLRAWHVFTIGIIAVIGIGFLIFRNGKSDHTLENVVRYKEFPVTLGTYKNSVTANGIVIPIDRVEVKSKASGLIVDMPVEEGDYIAKGALICRLDQTDVQADLDQAQAEFDIANAELKQAENSNNRQQQLYSKGLLSDEELDQVDLLLAQANGRIVRARTLLDQAKTRFSETIVRAPNDGVILQKYVEVGQIIASGISNVSGGTPIVDIADMISVYIEAGIDEIDVGKIRVGQTVGILADAYPNLTFSGEIIRIAPEARVEQNVTLFDVVIEVVNRDQQLKSGMNATVEITIVQQDNVLLIPTMALLKPEAPNKGTHMEEVLVKKDDNFVQQEVQLGLSDFEVAVIEDGLQEGDIVGVPMISRLKEDNDKMEERIRSSRSFGAQPTRQGQTNTRRNN
jgi:HlyD family secretion protein